jgi:hypothetical protein
MKKTILFMLIAALLCILTIGCLAGVNSSGETEHLPTLCWVLDCQICPPSVEIEHLPTLCRVLDCPVCPPVKL